MPATGLQTDFSRQIGTLRQLIETPPCMIVDQPDTGLADMQRQRLAVIGQADALQPVSYTHLTLPTILLV